MSKIVCETKIVINVRKMVQKNHKIKRIFSIDHNESAAVIIKERINRAHSWMSNNKH